MTKDIDDTTATDKPTGVRAKLTAYRAAHDGEASTVLPATGIRVSWPAHIPHATWMKAQRLAKKAPLNVANIYLALVCKFDGEKLTLEEIGELIPAADMLHLTGEVLGDDEDDEADAAGNVIN